MKILILEDEENIRGFLKINFERNNFIVIEASNGREAIEKSIKEEPDVAILDIMVPEIDGLTVCKILREKYSNMGIVMLTAKGQDLDKIMGLEYGADDYIVKPFNPLEITLRIKALMRRLKGHDNVDESITYGPFSVDSYSQTISKTQQPLDLTPTEFLMLKNFIKNPGKAFTRDELLNIVWGVDFFGDAKIVDVNIRRLRTKIENNPSEPEYIETVWGKGYRLRK
ncbi:DNA-binding response regulator, OmpR family, contains REC and winged-helix (wHTH) domain [Clostridium cavendishii DSM 21758]|uniref:Stage 0 sporulation protein A homolog n=1 Tax=Clostridium cavendishii DSM 21758 TaxID=1121302 RepID=A0A1M6EN26_9CLOT|nr:response regulator transcription factor [Clostridium cavendishii]SHI86718.1 DNA-binding response regulator, OmpR family, contains REC and winged-helix (wHTH) domain [Clostridium cavendishii DSM 21758]